MEVQAQAGAVATTIAMVEKGGWELQPDEMQVASSRPYDNASSRWMTNDAEGPVRPAWGRQACCRLARVSIRGGRDGERRRKWEFCRGALDDNGALKQAFLLSLEVLVSVWQMGDYGSTRALRAGPRFEGRRWQAQTRVLVSITVSYAGWPFLTGLATTERASKRPFERCSVAAKEI